MKVSAGTKRTEITSDELHAEPRTSLREVAARLKDHHMNHRVMTTKCIRALDAIAGPAMSICAHFTPSVTNFCRKAAAVEAPPHRLLPTTS